MKYKEYSLFDAHLHIIDPSYPLVENNGYLPKPFDCKDYLNQLKNIHLLGGAVVSGSFQGYDQSYLKAALKILGSKFVGVTQLPESVTDNELAELHQAGVRAVRFNIIRMGKTQLHYMEKIAQRVFDKMGWHIELYLESIELENLFTTLVKLPLVCIDHLGLSKEGFKQLLKLAEQGAYIKASGFGRVDFDVVNAMQELYSVNPNCLIFGTDLPSTRARRPFQYSDIDLVLSNFDETDAENILYKNAMTLYKVK